MILNIVKNTIYEALVNNVPINSIVTPTYIPNLYVIPSNIHLSAAEIELVNAPEREFVLNNILSNTKYDYDYIIIDCPPSLGLLTINALTAAHSIIIPVQCEFFAIEGLRHLLNTIDLVAEHLNNALSIEGIVLTMHDKRNKLSVQIENNIRKSLQNLVYKTTIPRNVRLSEAPSHGKPALIYDIGCPGSKAYIYLAKEILNNQLTEV